MSRRKILKIGLVGIGAIAASSIKLPMVGGALALPKSRKSSLTIALSEALRSIGTRPCLDAALRLENSRRDAASIRLHLRNAGIDSTGAIAIAKALRSISANDARTLQSFSLSYNMAIGDKGAVALAQALPSSLGELGLVGCGIGNDGGEALLRWADRATGLRMICLEENAFSEKLRSGFNRLARQKSRLYVSV